MPFQNHFRSEVPISFDEPMTWRYWIMVFACIWGTARCDSPAWAADEDPKLHAAKAAFTSASKKKSAPERIEAVKALSEFPDPGVLELLLRKACVDSDPGVRFVARESLTRLSENVEIRRTLFESWQQGLKKKSPLWADQLRALVATADEHQQQEIVKALDTLLSTPKGDLHSVIAVIDDYAEQGDEQAFTAVELLSRVNLFESSFGYRRAIIQALARIRSKKAVGVLITSMQNSQGLIMIDTITALMRITGQKFREDQAAWQEWWKANESTFEYPEMLGPPININDPNSPSFYGFPITAQRIVLVLDTSGSMRGLPIDAAKKALVATIESLPERVYFNVIAFDAQVVSWQKRLVTATPEAKVSACQSVIQRQLAFGTRSFSALQAAFDQNPEAIYFLSDGEPTDGNPQQIIETISQANRTRRISIYTVGVVTDRRGGIGLTQFMSPLSQLNWGEFRLVE